MSSQAFSLVFTPVQRGVKHQSLTPILEMGTVIVGPHESRMQMSQVFCSLRVTLQLDRLIDRSVCRGLGTWQVFDWYELPPMLLQKGS